MLIIRVILLMTFLLPINVWANGNSQTTIPINVNQNPSKSINEQSNENKYSSEPLKATLKEIMSQYHNPQISKEGSQQSYRWYNIITLCFNFLLVLVTALLVVYNCRLWKTTKGLLKENIKQGANNLSAIEASVRSARATETTAGAAQKSADAAEKSVIAAREIAKTMRAQDRAYIFVDIKLDRSNISAYEVLKIKESGLVGSYQASVRVINHGKTPAIIKSFRCKTDFFTDKEVIDYNAY